VKLVLVQVQRTHLEEGEKDDDVDDDVDVDDDEKGLKTVMMMFVENTTDTNTISA
jgi:hypothetical protein